MNYRMDLYILMALIVVVNLLSNGCTQKRMAVDYEIQVGGGFDFQHVKETETFRSGERFRLRVTTHEDCYAYIFNFGTSKTFHVLFPDLRINGGSNFVKGWQNIMIPPAGGKQEAYLFDANPGIETVIICIAGKPVPALDRIAHGEEKNPVQIEQIIYQLDSGSRRGATFAKIHHKEHTQVVLETSNREAVLINVICLNHVIKP
ncbi:MAG: DUF4384 domain-containing protein [Phycisphaerae bacterium]